MNEFIVNVIIYIQSKKITKNYGRGEDFHDKNIKNNIGKRSDCHAEEDHECRGQI